MFGYSVGTSSAETSVPQAAFGRSPGRGGSQEYRTNTPVTLPLDVEYVYTPNVESRVSYRIKAKMRWGPLAVSIDRFGAAAAAAVVIAAAVKPVMIL